MWIRVKDNEAVNLTVAESIDLLQGIIYFPAYHPEGGGRGREVTVAAAYLEGVRTAVNTLFHTRPY